ncbi:hypothetical protein [Brevibacillus migulae]|uniref:hypothetical protein n=1 Tax=Brevibacillus migulae TaxID=1644114 RepID=UPI00106E04B5|nr:hypothetical protein [Brevibacillus migulae]
MYKRYTNIYARWIRALASVIIFVGVTAGLFIWSDDFEDRFLPFLSTIFYSVIASLTMFGFAEIIEILYRIYQKLESVDGIKRLQENGSKPE